MKKILASLDKFFFAPKPLWQLGLFRILTGLIMFYYMSDKFIEYREFLTPEGYHLPPLDDIYMIPFYFAPLQEASALALVTVFLITCLCFTIGLCTRISSPLLLALFFYISMLDTLSAFTINKVFIGSLLLLSFSRAGDALSVDNWLREKRGSPMKDTHCSGWIHRTLQLTILLSYLVAGLCKALPWKGHWLKSSEVLFSQMGGTFQTEIAFWMMNTIPMPLWALIQHGALAFELFAIVLFFTPALRRFAIYSGIAFHLVIAATMAMLLPFSLQFISFYVFFWDKERER